MGQSYCVETTQFCGPCAALSKDVGTKATSAAAGEFLRDQTMLMRFTLGRKVANRILVADKAKETLIFFVNYVRQVVYGFLYELQFTVHQILVSEELIYVKCLKSLYLKK